MNYDENGNVEDITDIKNYVLILTLVNTNDYKEMIHINSLYALMCRMKEPNAYADEYNDLTIRFGITPKSGNALSFADILDTEDTAVVDMADGNTVIIKYTTDGMSMNDSEAMHGINGLISLFDLRHESKHKDLWTKYTGGVVVSNFKDENINRDRIGIISIADNSITSSNMAIVDTVIKGTLLDLTTDSVIKCGIITDGVTDSDSIKFEKLCESGNIYKSISTPMHSDEHSIIAEQPIKAGRTPEIILAEGKIISPYSKDGANLSAQGIDLDEFNNKILARIPTPPTDNTETYINPHDGDSDNTEETFPLEIPTQSKVEEEEESIVVEKEVLQVKEVEEPKAIIKEEPIEISIPLIKEIRLDEFSIEAIATRVAELLSKSIINTECDASRPPETSDTAICRGVEEKNREFVEDYTHNDVIADPKPIRDIIEENLIDLRSLVLEASSYLTAIESVETTVINGGKFSEADKYIVHTFDIYKYYHSNEETLIPPREQRRLKSIFTSI